MSINPYEIRRDFPMYQKHDSSYKGMDLTYLDNSATTFKPFSVIEAMRRYDEDITANTRRGDYTLAHDADVAYDKARERVARFINARPEELAFTSGTTMSLNEIAFGLMRILKPGDEILLSPAEHASNVLPWFKVAEITHAFIRYVPLSKEGRITVENYKASLTSKTKIVSLAGVSNVMGYALNVKEFAALAHRVGALYIDDAAQELPHKKIDVKDADVDFLAFSGHKMLGPTGIGGLYVKESLIDLLSPTFYGGEMNARFSSDGSLSLDDFPYRLEAGTQNISGALGLAKACDYLDQIGLENIHEHEMKLRRIAIEGLKRNGNAILYNEDADSGIITFNIKDVFAQDVATYLSSKGVFVRSGQHCAKILPEFLNTQGTVRASLYLYNTVEDIERFVQASATAEDFLDAFFN